MCEMRIVRDLGDRIPSCWPKHCANTLRGPVSPSRLCTDQFGDRLRDRCLTACDLTNGTSDRGLLDQGDHRVRDVVPRDLMVDLGQPEGDPARTVIVGESGSSPARVRGTASRPH